MRYWLLLLTSIVLSIAGIVWGILSKDPANGARGGAIAVMVSLVALFISRGYGAKVYDIIARQMQEIGKSADRPQGMSVEERIQALKNQITGLGEQIGLNTQEQFEQNVFLALSTATGTLAWGFGDMATTGLLYIMQIKPVPSCMCVN